MALEPRFLFDAAGVATAVEVVHSDDHAVPSATPDSHPVDQQLLAGLTAQPAAADAPAQPAAATVAPAAPAPSQPAHEVVFVDASVPQYETLLQGLPPATQVVTIDASRDGLAQIADALKDQRNVTAVHILSHGSAGEISLGNAEITSATLATHTAELDAIKDSLAPGADILIYGCDVAQGEQGIAFVNRLSAATGADVAASVDDTGNATLGGNWVLEAHTGAIESSIAVGAAAQDAYQGLLTNILPGSTGWTPLMQGTLFDPNNDTQAKAADTDLVGDPTHAVLYGAYDTNGTPDNPNDDALAFRIRIDNPTSSTEFGGVAVIGIDANQDGRIDLFLAVDGRNNTQAVRILDPGTGLNNSPSTTTTSALPVGWLPNNGVYSFTATNYSVAAVSATNDPQWDGTTDLGRDGKTDVFVSFKIPMADIAAVMAKPSASDRSGNVGPRGTTGIAGFTKDTTVSYVLMTETQPGPINGDLGGVGANYDKNATFAQLGAITGPMTPSNPVAVGQSVTINHTIGDGNLSASEDGAVLLQGKVGSTTADGSWVKVTVTDGASHSVTGYAQVTGGAWQMTKNLSSLNDGTVSVSAELWTTGTDSGSRLTNSVGDSTTVLHDRTPPVIAVSALATAGQPTISGTSDLPVGSTLTVTVDPNGDGVLTDAVVYKTTVKAGNVWSIDTAVAAPFSGAVAAGGFTRTASVAVSGADDAGNTTSVLAITKPTVNTLTTNSVTPTVNGTWGGTNGGTDSLSVRVNNVTYTTANGLTISGNSWSVALTANTGANALSSGHSYDVVATVTRTSPGGSTADASVNELQIVSGPSVDIGANGIGTAATINSSKPTITGTATPNALVVLVIDLDNSNATTSDRVTYSAVADGSGAWSINTASASPLSGSFPSSGLSGTVGLTATVTDSNGRTAVDTEALTITVPSIAIASVGGALPVASGSTSTDGILNGGEDDATVVLISATNVATNQTIAVSVSDGAHSAVTGTASYDAASGKWKATLNLSGLDDGTGNLTVSATYGQASASATVGHDTQAFATVISKEITSTSNATITGTADATAGSLTVTLVAYKQNNGGGSGPVTYTAQTPIVYTTSSTGVTFSNGTWSVPVPTSGGVINQNGEYYVVTVSGTDAAGNSVSATGQVTKISGTVPTVTIGAIATDNIIDATEDSALSITGSTNVSNGVVKVTVTDGTYSITQEVTASGTTWTLGNLNLHAWKGGPIFVEAQLLASSGSTTVWAEASATPTHTLATPPTIAITTPIGDGNLSANEDSSVTVTGTTTNAAGKTVTVTISDGTTSKTGTATVAADGSWTATFDSAHTNALSALNDATLQVTASVTANGSTANANASVLHDRTPPVVSITPLLTAGTPVVAGTTDLPAGSVITVTIDPDNVSGTAPTVSYQATVLGDHSWSVDLSSATPISGSLPVGGLTAYARITATGQDAAGNSTTTTALDKPAVNSLLTNSTTPTLTGTWANVSGSALYVVIDGKAYASTANQSVTLGGTGYTTVGGLTVSGDSWSVSSQALGAGTYNVQAYAILGANQAGDATTNELVVDRTAPTVAISGISTDSGSSPTDFITKDNRLVFSGTAEANANVLVTLKDASNAIVFTTTVVATGGNWVVDRSGQAALADGAYTLSATATDTAGNSATTSHSVVVDTAATIAITTNYKSASLTPVITGTSDLEAGRDILVTVNGATYTVQTGTGGGWSLDLAAAIPTSGDRTPLVDGQSYTITASGSDVAGNAASASKTMLVDASAPTVTVFGPLDWGGNSNGVLTLAEDSSVVIKGTTAKGASTTALAGSTLLVSITDGTTTRVDTATVQADGSWSLQPFNLRGFASGPITVTATYVDAGGVAYDGIATVLHDKSGTVSIDRISTDSGTPDDFVTSDRTLVFQGTATAGQSVSVTLKDSANATVFSGTVTANSSGTWTYDHQGSNLADGTYTLSATCNSVTATQSVVVDGAPPAGPVTVAAQTTASVTPTITGTATVAAGETLTVTVNGKTYTAGDGHLTLTGTAWSLAIPSGDALTPATSDHGFNGVYSVTASIRDLAGNILNDPSSGELTIADTTKPVIDLDTATSGSGHAVTSTDGAAVSLDNDSAAATLVEANTLQSVTIAVGGLRNGSSETLVFGQTAIAADGSSGPRTGIVVGGVGVNVTYANGAFTITKADWSNLTSAEGQAIIRDLQYRNALGSGATAGQRTFAFRAIDDAGNLSDAATATVTVSAGAAAAPSQAVTISSAADDVAPVTGALGDGARTNDTGPTLQGTLSAALNAGEVLAVYRDGAKIGNATVNGTGWSYADSGLSDGTTYSYTARVENGGAQGTASSAFTLTIDTTVAAPTLTLVTDSGASGSDRVSNVGTVAVSNLEAGAAWEYSIDGGTNWTSGSGSSFTLAEGSHADGTVKVRQTDAAGNVSAAASLGATVIDATAPEIAGATVTGSTLVLGYSEANRLDAVNHAGPGAFTVKVGGSTVAVNAVGVDAANNTVTLTLGSAVVAGQSVTVSYADPTAGDDTSATQDEAGNDAAGFTDRAVTNATPATTPGQTVLITKAVDDVAPRTGDLASGASTNDTAPDLRGTLSAALGTGEVLAVYRDGVKIGTATVDGTDWRYADSGLSNGATYRYTARVENLVNPGTASTAFALTIDTAAPGAPTITSVTDDVAPVIGTVVNGGVTNDSTPALTGAAEANSTVSVYDGATLLGTTTANGSGVWTYTPSALSQGAHSFTVTATDAAGNVSGASSAYALTIDAAPVGTDTTISTLEDTPRTLSLADFGFRDADVGDALVTVKVTQLPAAGALTLNGAGVVLDQEISKADIEAGKLVFAPAVNANGAGYARFAFKVSDGTVYATDANIVTFDVTAVNDAPVAAASSISMLEDATRAFQAGDFGFTDVEGHGLAAVIITSRPVAGTLAYNGTALTDGDVASGFVVAAADLGKLTFTPAADANGAGYASVAFKVRDNGGTASGGQDTSATAVLTINVTAVNDAPTGADKTVGTAEDTPYTLTAADFGFADVDAGAALAAVKVTRLPAAGALTLNGTAVTADQAISKADIDAGKLVFTPAANANGAGYASFAFNVSDGALYSATANTITIDVSAVNDAPVATAQTVAAVEDVERTITLSGTDVDGDALTYRVNRPAAGTLFQVNADGSRGDAITADGTLVTDGAHRVIYLSAPDGNGAGHGTFTFTAADASAASAPATVTVNVAPVNDAPALTGAKATLASGTEDAPYTIRKADLLAGYTDADGDALAVTGLTATNGTLTDNGDGTWTFVPNADHNGTVALTYAVTDGKGGSVTASNSFALAAVNDAAVIGNPVSAAVTEDVNVTNGRLIATGTLSIQDVDAGEATFRTTVGSDQGNLGSLALQADGTYVYSVDNGAVQHLGAGQTKTDRFTVTSVDGTTKRIGFTITGTNDAAVIGTPSVPSVTEDLNVVDGALTATGTIAISDADQGQAAFQTAVASSAGNLGRLTLQVDGRYVYAVDNGAVQFLGAGQTKVDTFTVSAKDGTTRQVAITINGANDAPTFTSAPAGATYADTSAPDTLQAFAGTLAARDIDSDAVTFGISGGTVQGGVVSKATAYGTLTVNSATGAFTFVPDSAAIDALPSGVNPSEAFTVTATDGHGGQATQILTITITGANETPAVTPAPASTPAETPVAQPAPPTLTAPTPVVLATVDPAHAPATAGTSVSQAVASVMSATASTLPRASLDLTVQDSAPGIVAQTAMNRDTGGQSSSAGVTPSSYRGNSLLPPSVSLVASSDTLGGASLITVGSVGDRVVTPGQPNLISVPAGTFQTSDPNAHITLQATLSDGSPLPAWLKFDSANGTFSGNPPPDLKATMSIKVIARDDQGAQATTEFRLNIGNNASDGAGDEAPKPAAGRGNADGKAPADGQTVPESQPDAPAETTPPAPEPGKRADADAVKAPVGKLAFSRQVGLHAPSGLLAEGAELLRSVQMLLAG